MRRGTVRSGPLRNPATGREKFKSRAALAAHIVNLETQMRAAAANLEFERAAQIRDQLKKIRNPDLVLVGGTKEEGAA